MRFRSNFFASARAAGIFLAMLLSGGAEANTQGGAYPQRTGPSLSLSPVIIAERPEAVQGFTADPEQVRQMVDRDLLTLTSSRDIGTAWKRLGITPRDIVGIKITTAGGPGFCTHPALVRAICDGLQAAGVPPAQIIIWDKFRDKMRPAGYALRAATDGQPAIASIVPGNYYDPAVFYKNGVIGNLIWGDYQFNQGVDSDFYDSSPVVSRSYYTKFVTQACTKLINVPVLSYNEQFGIDGCLSSLALGSTDNNRRFLGPPSYGDPAIDEVFDQDFIRRKVVVHILDALVAQCAGGPAFNPQFCRQFGAIYVGRDPVAIDSLALPRLEKIRREMSVPTVGNTSCYLTSAAVLGLGTTDRRRIQFLRVP
ncbi:MAG TPA: DUF362 domain-containing protein [Candidatus Methylacidiphilales bacterium]|jgi:hypothetical protein|nr:DUF362 domain-containing protein [Candidatus Methylacidiphilales bacterium]